MARHGPRRAPLDDKLSITVSGTARQAEVAAALTLRFDPAVLDHVRACGRRRADVIETPSLRWMTAAARDGVRHGQKKIGSPVANSAGNVYL